MCYLIIYIVIKKCAKQQERDNTSPHSITISTEELFSNYASFELRQAVKETFLASNATALYT
jgi:hypothetical protein